MKKNYVLALFDILPSHKQAVIYATVDHLCHGYKQSEAAVKHGTLQTSVARASAKIKKLDKLIAKAILIKICDEN